MAVMERAIRPFLENTIAGKGLKFGWTALVSA